MVTTRIITPLKVSSRIDQVTSTPPATIHCTRGMICGSGAVRMSRKTKIPNTADSSSAPQVMICAPRSPIARPKKPAMTAAKNGRKTMAGANPSAFHYVDVFDPDRAAVAEIDDEDGEPDRRLGRGDGQHEHRKGLADKVVAEYRKGHEVDVDRKQHQLDRHQDDDYVLAVQEDAKNPEREQDRRHGQVMGKTDQHPTPSPTGTLTI